MVFICYQIIIVLQLLKLCFLDTHQHPFSLAQSHHYNLLKRRQPMVPRSIENANTVTDYIEVYLDKELNGIRRPRKSNTSSERTRKKTSCLKCKTKTSGFYLHPAFSCDEWSSDSGTCILDRNVGATVTLSLKFGSDRSHLPSVVWKQEFHLLTGEKTKEFVIDPDNSPWNIVIGNKGYEFRISPITEQDVDFNYFTVNLAQSEKIFHPKAKKFHFRIRIIPINLGFLYLGETFTLNIESFISLPAESIKYKWHVEKSGERSTLPSNMKKSLSGRVLTISELRKNQEGVVACSVYSNQNIFVAKRRFLIKHISKGYESEMPSNISKRKGRHLELEGDIDQALTEMDKKKSDSNETEGFDLPETAPNRQDHPLIEPTSIYQNKHLMNHLNNFHIDPEIQQFDKINQPKPYGEETLDDDDDSKPDDQNQMQNGQQKTKSSNFNSPQKSFEDIDETSNTHNYRSKGRFQDKKQSGHGRPKSFNYFPSKQSSKDFQDNGPNDQKQKLDDSGVGDLNFLSDHLSENSDEKSSEDTLSKLISTCNKNTQCSIHATCINLDGMKSGFCRCITGFQGNGISCWEVKRFSDSV